MRRSIRWAARLYPAAWRARYGDEFAALLEDVAPRWRDGLDVLQGALKMQLAAWSYRKTVAVMGLAGAILAAVISAQMPGRYVSTAFLRIRGGTRMAVTAALPEVLSRRSLVDIIQVENLYRTERRHHPLEEVIDTMRRDIALDIVEPSAVRPLGIRVRFSYPDAALAQRTNRELTRRLLETQAKSGYSTEVILPATLPARPVHPSHTVAILGGLLAGLLVGAAATGIHRRPTRWTLRVASAGLAGMLLGGAASYVVADRYVSSALMRISKGAQAALPAALSEESLAAIVRACDLYPGQRDAIDRIRRDVRVTRVNATTQFDVYRIAFTSGDSYKAQRAVREIVQRTAQSAARAGNGGRPLKGASDNQEFLAWLALPQGAVELIDAASFPEAPAGPNRLVAAMLGMLAGLMVGGYVWRSSAANIQQPAAA